MRQLIIFCLLLTPFAGASAMTSQQCQNMKEVYGQTPDSCTAIVQDVSFAIEAPTRVVPENEPTALQRQNHVFFTRGGSALDPTALQQIQILATLMNGVALGDACVALIGHSDTSGSEAANTQIAMARAETVGRAIAAALEDPNRIEKVISLGEVMPLENLSPQSRWQRRVEIRARDCAS